MARANGFTVNKGELLLNTSLILGKSNFNASGSYCCLYHPFVLHSSETYMSDENYGNTFIDGTRTGDTRPKERY